MAAWQHQAPQQGEVVLPWLVADIHGATTDSSCHGVQRACVRQWQVAVVYSVGACVREAQQQAKAREGAAGLHTLTIYGH